MKMRSIFALILFCFAASSAVAAHVITGLIGYSRKTDVPVQANHCEARKKCPGGPNPCTISVDHDGNPITLQIMVKLYDGKSTPQTICGAELFEP